MRKFVGTCLEIVHTPPTIYTYDNCLISRCSRFILHIYMHTHLTVGRAVFREYHKSELVRRRGWGKSLSIKEVMRLFAICTSALTMQEREREN